MRPRVTWTSPPDALRVIYADGAAAELGALTLPNAAAGGLVFGAQGVVFTTASDAALESVSPNGGPATLAC